MTHVDRVELEPRWEDDVYFWTYEMVYPDDMPQENHRLDFITFEDANHLLPDHPTKLRGLVEFFRKVNQ
jgi:hypothetical protein